MTAVEQLDDQALLDLSGRTDPLGVVSVYVNDDPTGSHDASAIDIKNRYRELQRRVSEDPTKRKIASALDRLWAEVEPLTNPAESGRGRVLFTALEGEWAVRLESQMPLPNRVVLDDGPFIHPLLELLDEGRPAGVVLVSPHDARLLEWRLGKLRLLTRLEQEEVEAPHERAGQLGGGPPGQFNTPVMEHRKARQRHWTQQLLNRVGEVATTLAGERGWVRILVSGGDRWTEPIAARVPAPLQDVVIRDPRVLTGLDDNRLLATVTERLHADHASREAQLLDHVLEAGRGATGALGLSQVVAALNAGRVAHLVYDPGVRYTGSIGSDGALYADDEIGGAAPASPEPRLTERLVERALATGARVSPVEGAADGVLSAAAGIGALLRW